MAYTKKRLVGIKKSIFITLISFIVIFLSSNSVNANWTSVTPPELSSSYWLESVHFPSSNEGWAVGITGDAKGVLFHYLNGTLTSVTPPEVISPWRLMLESVHFTSSNEGWAVGTGAFLHYKNGNWNFIASPLGTERSLHSVHFTSSNEGWAVGPEVYLLHYMNGAWISVPSPYLYYPWFLNSVHFTSSKEGWAVGYFYETIIGGPPFTRKHGGVLFHYLNGTWTSVTPPEVSSNWELNDVHFTSSNEGWAVGWNIINQRGVLLHYLNGSWTSVLPPNVSSGWSLFGVHFISPNEGWAVGGGGKNGILLRYLNGNWTSVTPPNVGVDSSGWGLNDVHFTSSNEGWAVGGKTLNNGSQKGVLLKYFSIPSGPLPDLTGEWDSLNASCRTIFNTTRCSINGKFNIQNIGEENAPSVKINFYVSDDALYDDGDTYLFQKTTQDISAGGDISISFRTRTNLPLGMSVKGRYIIAVIDPDNILEESDKNNNQFVYGPIP